jgi:hypothetical protein
MPEKARIQGGRSDTLASGPPLSCAFVEVTDHEATGVICQVGTTSYSATAGLAQAGQVNVTPIGTLSDPGLQFNGAFSVPTGVNPADIVLQFTVTAPTSSESRSSRSTLRPLGQAFAKSWAVVPSSISAFNRR